MSRFKDEHYEAGDEKVSIMAGGIHAISHETTFLPPYQERRVHVKKYLHTSTRNRLISDTICVVAPDPYGSVPFGRIRFRRSGSG